MSTLSERLVQLKAERNLLQKDIARDTGLSLRAYRTSASNVFSYKSRW